MKKQGKKILKSILIFVLLGGVITFFIYNFKDIYKNTEEFNEDINNTVIEESKDNEKQNQENADVLLSEEILEQKNNIEMKEEIKEESKINKEVEVSTQNDNNKQTNKNNIIVTNTSKKNETVKINENLKQEIKEEPKKDETTKPTNTQVISPPSTTVPESKPQEKKEPKKDVHIYKYNASITEKIRQDIINNESAYMKEYGYNIVVDESIVNLTNQFTYTNNRVKNMIVNKFGTIRIYARDYYLNGNYMYTESYII